MNEEQDKFKIGDNVYWLGSTDDPDHIEVGKVIDYNPGGFGCLKWVKYKVEFQGTKKSYTFFLGNDLSPDVFGSKVLSKEEYELRKAKQEYQEIIDHGNGD